MNVLSVTDIINQYTPVFNAEYWSKIKALEELIPKEIWKDEKVRIMRNIIPPDIFKRNNIDMEEFDVIQKRILNSWVLKQETSKKRGIDNHKELEKQFKITPSIKEELGNSLVTTDTTEYKEFISGLYPEFKINFEYSDKLKIIGRADLVAINSEDKLFSIIDHKWSKKLTHKGHFIQDVKTTEKMLYPLNGLENCNFNHYALQLSLYAYMLENLHLSYSIHKLLINHFDEKNNNTVVQVPYLKKEVELLLKSINNGILKQERKQRRLPIEY